jgi:hypothetical protein
MAKRLGEEYWRKHLQSWERSGLSQIAYCTQQGLKAKTFSRWRGKALARTEAASKAPPLTVVPIRVETSATRATPGIVRLHSPGGWRIELADSSAIKLAELLRQLP